MAKKAMPKVLYVRRDEEDNESYFIAEELLADVVLEEGKTFVGTYKLDDARNYEKIVAAAD